MLQFVTGVVISWFLSSTISYASSTISYECNALRLIRRLCVLVWTFCLSLHMVFASVAHTVLWRASSLCWYINLADICGCPFHLVYAVLASPYGGVTLGLRVSGYSGFGYSSYPASLISYLTIYNGCYHSLIWSALHILCVHPYARAYLLLYWANLAYTGPWEMWAMPTLIGAWLKF